MTTLKQAEANRRNAAHSTGPRTQEGKKISALNALKHGGTSETPVLPTEDPAHYGEFRTQLSHALAPNGAVEEQLVSEIVDLSWRLQRAGKVELGVFAGNVAALDQRFLADRRRRLEITEGDIVFAQRPSLDDLIEIVHEDAHAYLNGQIDEAESVQRSDEVRLGTAFLEDAAGPNAFAKLSRYETSVFRRRNQALETLLRLQAERNNASPKETQ